MKMLSALSAVADDIDENVEEEEPDFTPRTKKYEFHHFISLNHQLFKNFFLLCMLNILKLL